jgi:hypothetical protein
VTLASFGFGFLFANKFLAANICSWMAAVSLILRFGAYAWKEFRNKKILSAALFAGAVMAAQLFLVIPWIEREKVEVEKVTKAGEKRPDNLPAPTSPPIENPPAAEKKVPINSVGKTELPAFAVDIEHRMFTEPGPNGTGFWFGGFGLSSCSLQPTGTAIFLRITNLQQHKEMITAYSISGLRKIQVLHGRMFVILPKGEIGNGFVPKAIDFGAPVGMGMLVGFPVDDADTSKAIPVTGDFLDYKIGEGHYLETDEAVRGWVFFEYHKGYVAIPGHLTIEITDQFQHSFSYLIPDHIGNPEGDILPRRIVQGPLEDLSKCTVVK